MTQHNKRHCADLNSSSSSDDASVRDELKEVKDRLDKVLQAMDCITKSVGDVITTMDKNEERFAFFSATIKEQTTVIGELKEELSDYKRRVDSLEFRVIDQEARGRRNNLLFHGVAEGHGEDCLKIARDIIRNCNLSGDVRIERAHRVPPLQTETSTRRQTC